MDRWMDGAFYLELKNWKYQRANEQEQPTFHIEDSVRYQSSSYVDWYDFILFRS